MYVCLFSTICRAAPYLLSCWTQIKAFHSNSLSGNRGTLHFIYKPSYAVGTKPFIKGLAPEQEGKHFIFWWHSCAVQNSSSVTTCHSITACRTCHILHKLECIFYVAYTHNHIWTVLHESPHQSLMWHVPFLHHSALQVIIYYCSITRIWSSKTEMVNLTIFCLKRKLLL